MSPAGQTTRMVHDNAALFFILFFFWVALPCEPSILEGLEGGPGGDPCCQSCSSLERRCRVWQGPKGLNASCISPMASHWAPRYLELFGGR